MTTRTILVTGGAGYIGSHTCKALVNAGFSPVVYDNLSTGYRESVQFGPLVEGDIRDAALLQKTFAGHKPVAVMHFAAKLAVGESVEKPEEYYDVNVRGAWNILHNARTAGIPIVFSSTAAVYGIPETFPVTENAPLAPINPYGHSKRMVEQMLADSSHAYGLKYASLRYFNACGADAEGQLGLRQTNPTHLIPSAIEAILGTRPPLLVFGTDYPTEDGTAVRDYIHVTDLAEAHVAALNYLLGGGDSNIFNLGTGRGYSVKQIVDAVESATGQQVPHQNHERRAGDPPALVAAVEKARNILAWQASQSDLPNIVSTAWSWRQQLTNNAKAL